MVFNQRFLVVSFAIMLIITQACKEPTKNKSVGLKDVSDFPVGAAVNLKHVLVDSALQEILLKNFNSLTSRYHMKMNRIIPSEGEYYWGVADTLLNYAQQHDMRLFGHNLIWHSSTPQWVVDKAASDSAWLEMFMKDYVQTYVGRYKGKVDGWDVVNEGMNTAGGEYRESFWYNSLGKEYIAKAFQYAHEADPEAILFYNDFNIERDTAKLHAVLRMIDELKQQGVPISGLGFQMHIRMDIPDTLIAYSLRKGAETGLQIHLSEVDLIFNKHNDERFGGIQLYDELTDSMKVAQGAKYKKLAEMYKTIVPPEQQYGITFWGFNDRDTWINGFFNLQDWPSLFDTTLQAKPAYYGFMEGLQSKSD